MAAHGVAPEGEYCRRLVNQPRRLPLLSGLVQQPPQRLTQFSVAAIFVLCSTHRTTSMAQHFLLSAAARSLDPSKVMRMSDRRAEKVFARLRWPQTDGKPVCPRCGGSTCYSCPRSADQPRWRCKACRADFSITSGTLF